MEGEVLRSQIVGTEYSIRRSAWNDRVNGKIDIGCSGWEWKAQQLERWNGNHH